MGPRSSCYPATLLEHVHGGATLKHLQYHRDSTTVFISGLLPGTVFLKHSSETKLLTESRIQEVLQLFQDGAASSLPRFLLFSPCKITAAKSKMLQC